MQISDVREIFNRLYEYVLLANLDGNIIWMSDDVSKLVGRNLINSKLKKALNSSWRSKALEIIRQSLKYRMKKLNIEIPDKIE